MAATTTSTTQGMTTPEVLLNRVEDLSQGASEILEIIEEANDDSPDYLELMEKTTTVYTELYDMYVSLKSMQRRAN